MQRSKRHDNAKFLAIRDHTRDLRHFTPVKTTQSALRWSAHLVRRC